jgi:hypothetical protein
MPPLKLIGSALFLLALGSFGVLSWALRKIALLDRAAQAGDVVVLAVLAIFGCFCVTLGWLLFRMKHATLPRPVETPASRRVGLSHGCATAGVLLLMLSVLVPAHWHPVVLLFAGLALLAVSHVLTPCEERIAKLRRARSSLEQL